MRFSLDDAAAAPLLMRYPGGEATRRYYQDAAFRLLFQKIAKCERKGKPTRASLSLATGAGKTFIARHAASRKNVDSCWRERNLRQEESDDVSLIDQIFGEMFSIIKDKPEFNAETIQNLKNAYKNGKFKKVEKISELLRRQNGRIK